MLSSAAPMGNDTGPTVICPRRVVLAAPPGVCEDHARRVEHTRAPRAPM
jgi:hypothetical protein